jgi:hypothetical protein
MSMMRQRASMSNEYALSSTCAYLAYTCFIVDCSTLAQVNCWFDRLQFYSTTFAFWLGLAPMFLIVVDCTRTRGELTTDDTNTHVDAYVYAHVLLQWHDAMTNDNRSNNKRFVCPTINQGHVFACLLTCAWHTAMYVTMPSTKRNEHKFDSIARKQCIADRIHNTKCTHAPRETHWNKSENDTNNRVNVDIHHRLGIVHMSTDIFDKYKIILWHQHERNNDRKRSANYLLNVNVQLSKTSDVNMSQSPHIQENKAHRLGLSALVNNCTTQMSPVVAVWPSSSAGIHLSVMCVMNVNTNAFLNMCM